MSGGQITFASALLVTAPILLANEPDIRTTAAHELNRLQRPDAAQYASDLYENNKRWSYVSDNIAGGKQEWLLVAKALIPRADGAFAEELRTDLAAALVAMPANVLRLMKQTDGSSRIKPSYICDAPFPSPGKEWLIRYKRRAIHAVGKVREAGLRRVRDDCLKTLRGVDLSKPAEFYE